MWTTMPFELDAEEHWAIATVGKPVRKTSLRACAATGNCVTVARWGTRRRCSQCHCGCNCRLVC